MPKKKKSNTPLQSYNSAKFGLQICERAAGDSTVVITVASQFFKLFGKDEPRSMSV